MSKDLAGKGEILSDLGVSPLQLSFGNIDLGTSYTLPLTLTNTSSATLAILAFNLSPSFTQTNDCNGSLAPATTCTVNVTFAPTALGDQSGTVGIDHSGKGSPQVIFLTGGGTTPLRVTPTSLTFGQQSVGTVSAPQSVGLSLSDQSSTPVTINSITVSGDFQLASNACPNPIPQFFGCVVQVGFAPTEAGLRSGNLTISASDYSNPRIVALSGTGAIVPAVALTPGSLSFAALQEGSTSAPQTVTLQNIGSATLTITGILCAVGSGWGCLRMVPARPLMRRREQDWLRLCSSLSYSG